MAEVFIIAAGPVGSGKSAILGEIEIALKALGIPVRYDNEKGARSEKHMTGADWQSELERTNPTVTLVETIGFDAFNQPFSKI